jgi:hypothetical protein
MAKQNNRKNRMRGILGFRSRGQLMKEAKARTRLELGPVGRELGGQFRASKQDSRNINSWYGQYQNQMARLRGEQRDAFTQAQSNARANADYLSGQGSDSASAVQTDQDRSAAIRGVTADPGAAATESAAAAQRRALLASGADRLNAVTLSAQSRLANTNQAAELGRQADQRQERNRRAEIRARKADLARDKGAAMVKNLGDLTQTERDWSIQNRTLKQKDRYSNAMITQAQLGLAGKQASANATLGAAQLYSGAKIKAAKIYNAGGGKKVKGGDVLRAQDYLRAELGASGASWQDVRNNRQKWVAQLTNRGADPVAARVAVRRYLKNKLGRGGAWAGERR